MASYLIIFIASQFPPHKLSASALKGNTSISRNQCF
jgi:hypothetical protein